MSDRRTTIDVHLAAAEWLDSLIAAARRSLTSDPPHLDPVWFYDELGSQLFDTITRLPEYYLTRSERALLETHAASIAAVGAHTLVELGSGTSEKTTVLLDAMTAAGTLQRYVPFDVSEATLRTAIEQVAVAYPDLALHGVVGDFHHHLGAIPSGERRMVAFLGSTIGNLEPPRRRRFLVDLDCALERRDWLLLGIDLVKDPDRLVAAYDDSEGVTAEFNRNALRVLNTALGSDFDAEAFEHVALWDPRERRIEMRLRARREQHVTVPGHDGALAFTAGIELRTEICTKFTVEGMTAELWECGFVVDEAWTDPDGDFALLLAHPYC